MDYLKFHELACEPFQNALDARFYFESQAQAHARLRLERGLRQQRALLALVGAPGLGKSTLAHQLSMSLDPAKYLVQLRSIPHAACAQGWLLPKVAQAFSASDISSDPVRLLEQIHYALLVARSRGRHPVLIVNEAQLLASTEVMREFRGLLNLLDDGRPLLSVVLCGLPELDRALELDAPLAQRVEVRCRLEPLAEAETAAYLQHRLACAGCQTPLFEAEAVSALTRWSGGVPRLLNTLADNALFESAVSGVRPVDVDSVLAAADQLGLAQLPPPSAAPATPPAEPRAPAPAPAQPAAPAAPRRPALEPAAAPPVRLAAQPAAPAAPPRPAQPAAPAPTPTPASAAPPRPAPRPAAAASPAAAQPAAAAAPPRPPTPPAAPPAPAPARAAPAAPAAAPRPPTPPPPAPVRAAPKPPEPAVMDMLEIDFDEPSAPAAAPRSAPASVAALDFSEEASAIETAEDDFLDLGGLLELEEDPAAAAEPDPVTTLEAEAAPDLDSLFAQIQRPQ